MKFSHISVKVGKYPGLMETKKYEIMEMREFYKIDTWTLEPVSLHLDDVTVVCVTLHPRLCGEGDGTEVTGMFGTRPLAVRHQNVLLHVVDCRQVKVALGAANPLLG